MMFGEGFFDVCHGHFLEANAVSIVKKVLKNLNRASESAFLTEKPKNQKTHKTPHFLPIFWGKKDEKKG